MDCRSSQAYFVWRRFLREAAVKSNIKFKERNSGVWDAELILPDGTNKTLTVSTSHAINVTPTLVESRNEFLNLAQRVRAQEPLDLLELSKLRTLVVPMSLSRLSQVEEELANLVIKYWTLHGQSIELTSVEQSRMLELDTLYLCQRWGYSNLKLRQQILPKAQVPDPVERLLSSTHVGPQRSRGPIPNERDRRLLEVELNNLLIRKRRMEKYSDHEDAKLVFLLRPLINPRLLLVLRRIERLRTRLEKGDFG